ncbi:uncharacterized protein ARMOST_11151 [Armillaria ostoyae]|uniref:Survival motor neuron Tudor domain-containing protein n=1 Tax=Armillaria ostoyae TaxID=47428 RepID=A0A284RGC6_ARMOS|nr:uncharacterized protein ARMOST_11151 [Armillaria ostoyae]
MRPIVSYEDIASTPASHYDSQAPPAKKRKTNHRNQRNRNRGRREEEENKELTHDEIWDDSALIDAWTAANEEYAAYHGEDKSWKDEYPPDDVEPTPKDSQPLLNVNFEPSHDPPASQDEAFQRAMSAMYWAGYWTAVYHHKKRLQEEEEEEGEGEEEEVEVEENLVSTQR